jgi:hypothetical protein
LCIYIDDDDDGDDDDDDDDGDGDGDGDDDDDDPHVPNISDWDSWIYSLVSSKLSLEASIEKTDLA